MTFEYKTKPINNLRANFNDRKRKSLNGFNDFEDFLAWYNEQDKTCAYCGLKEEECQEIVISGILTSNRFPQNGIIRQGQNRGVWLEVDRLDPKGLYSRENSTLSCYFCNNDKSDVFSAEDYKSFFQNRANFIRGLLT